MTAFRPTLAAVATVALLVAGASVRRSPASQSAPPLAIVNVTVIPVARAGSLPNQTVVMRAGRIIALGPSNAVRPPAGARVIDGRGKFLIPGLVDAHVHLEEDADLPQFVASGVTTVRDLMGSPETLAWRESTADGRAVGPRIIAAGPLFAGPEVPWRKKFTTENPDSARAEVRRQHAAGYDLIKIYDGLTPAVYAAVMDEARTLGITATGHIPQTVHLGGVLAAKQNLEHTDKLVFDMWGHSFDTTRIDSVVRAIAAAGVFVTPTIASMQQLARVGSGGFDSLLARPDARRVGPVTLDVWCSYTSRLRNYRQIPAGTLYNSYTDFQMKVIRAEQRVGVPLIAGTDYPNAMLAPGASLIEELVALHESGLSNVEALRSATTTAGRAIGDTMSGVVTVGARADVVLLTANPLDDLRSARTPRWRRLERQVVLARRARLVGTRAPDRTDVRGEDVQVESHCIREATPPLSSGSRRTQAGRTALSRCANASARRKLSAPPRRAGCDSACAGESSGVATPS